MEKQKRYRRVNSDGEWEYKCISCEIWKLKDKFAGCVEKTDGFGNCLTCRSCITSKANKTKEHNIQREVREILTILGYELDNPEYPVWKQFNDKHNIY